MFKKFIALLVSLATVFTAVSCEGKKSEEETVTSTVYPDFTVTFFDVGKADSILLQTENSTVIIDCGEKGDGKEIVSFLEEQNIDSVDCLIITHYDKDHVGGSAKVINKLDVKRVLAPDYEEESDEVEKYRKALDSKGITPELLTQDTEFELDGVSYTVYAPQKTFYGEDNDNDFSLVTKAVYHDTSIIFAGDAMEQRLEEVMDIGTCTLLKVPYHARELDNLGEFLDNTKPKCAVSCTSAEEFDKSTQKALYERGIKSYSTCENGRITAVSNGNQIEISTEK